MLARSAGISVAFFHAPLAYRSKSSPGFTDLSMPARSMPAVGAAAWSVGALRWQADSVARMASARAARRTVVVMREPRGGDPRILRRWGFGACAGSQAGAGHAPGRARLKRS